MLRHHCLFALTLASCELLFVDNPGNCVRNKDACGRDTYCNLETQNCESLDCTVNTALCKSTEFCDRATLRCMTKDCVVDPLLCTATQTCELVTRQCQTRTFVLGQPDEKSNLNTAYGMRNPIAVLLSPDPLDGKKTKLIVADANNQRVLIWNDVPIKNRPADAVLGVPDVHTISANGPYGGVSGSSLRFPWSLASDGTQLIVGDFNLNRLLAWNQIPTQPGASGPIPAGRLWGQISFSDSQANAGLFMIGPLGVNTPKVFIERLPGKGYFVSDSNNHRVLVFNDSPNNPQNPPDFVLGQTSFTTNTPGTTAAQLYNPRSLFSDGTQLFVNDFINNRVVAFNLPLTQNGPSATLVLGQPNFTTGSSNSGGAASAATLAYPSGLSLLGGPTRRLFVSDQLNHRVLRYTLPATTADLVLGQADFTTTQPNRGSAPAASTLNQPQDVSSDGTRLAVADYINNRVLLWNSLPTQNGQAADLVLGQPDPTSVLGNNPPSNGPRQFRTPAAVATDGTRLLVTDSGNHRVLIWNQIPRDGTVAPDLVLGQSDFSAVRANAGLATPSAATLSNPSGLSIENGQLAVADTGNNRVLIWNQLPTQTGQPADVVIGQPDFTSAMARVGSGFSEPASVVLNGGQLYVADARNSRILLFRGPLVLGAIAGLVLGQPNYASAIANYNGQSASSLANPGTLLIYQGKLLVADRNNHRVLVWNRLPTVSAQPADVVIGQSDFVSAYTDADPARVAGPSGLLVDKGRLYVASAVHNRILYWNQLPTSNGQRASGVLGQPTIFTSLPNHPEVTPVEKLSAPGGLAVAADQLLIADVQNNRIVVRGLPL